MELASGTASHTTVGLQCTFIGGNGSSLFPLGTAQNKMGVGVSVSGHSTSHGPQDCLHLLGCHCAWQAASGHPSTFSLTKETVTQKVESSLSFFLLFLPLLLSNFSWLPLHPRFNHFIYQSCDSQFRLGSRVSAHNNALKQEASAPGRSSLTGNREGYCLRGEAKR